MILNINSWCGGCELWAGGEGEPHPAPRLVGLFAVLSQCVGRVRAVLATDTQRSH